MPKPSHTTRRLFSIFMLAFAGSLLTGCEDKMKGIDAEAGPALEAAMVLVKRDTAQVRKGMPKGLQTMAKLLDTDPGADLEGIKRAITKTRTEIEELAFAKSTFFIFVAPDGKVLRGQTDPDLPAGHSLTEAIPGTKALFADDAGLVEAWGYMHGLRGVNKGGDLQWVVGGPVRSKQNKVLGAFVTGWSLRKYALYLEDHARNHLRSNAVNKDKAISLLYAFVVKGQKAFGGPVTPDISAEAVGAMGLFDKAKDGMFRGPLMVGKRAFWVVAQRAPDMGSDVVVALMLSPL